MKKNLSSLIKQRYKILLNYIVGPLLFIVLSYSIYQKILKQPHLQQSADAMIAEFNDSKKWLLILMIILMGINWGLEARKWQILMRPVQRVSFFTAWKAVLSGLSFSLFLPNGVGEYVGRILYMREGNRLRSVPLTIVGSMSQLIVTLIAGIVGLIYLRSHILTPHKQLEGLSVFWLNGLMYAVIAGILVFLLIYFKLSWFTRWFEKIPFVYKHRLLIQSLEDFHWRELTRILILSLCRFSVFIVQYLLMLYIFSVDIYWLDAVCTTFVLFLMLAIVPTIPIADLGVRGEISIQLFGLLTKNVIGVVTAAASIWVVNLIIPALAGSLFILGIKLFRNK
ncbi:MAG: lysylphosphatidylglycerol synthase domain-containing protein [Ilyomonas sp.]